MTILLITVLLFEAGKIEGLPFMMIFGIAIYLSYVPYNGVIFDVLIALFQL
jgi:hypothetical protein